MKPADIAPDEYERDETGKIILNKDGSKRKKRGRKQGQSYGETASSGASKTQANKASAKSNSGNGNTAEAIKMLAAQFQILNTGVAYFTRFDDWRLTDSEANEMAKATSNVLEQFDYVPDPKVAAMLGLVTTTSMIYGPRAYLYRQHIANQKAERAKQARTAADEMAAQSHGTGQTDSAEPESVIRDINFGGMSG